MNLRKAPVGQPLQVTEIAENPLEVRMQSMGIRVGATLTILNRAASGSRVIRVGDARINVAAEIADSIEVREMSRNV